MRQLCKEKNEITEARLIFFSLTTSHVTTLAQPVLSLGGVVEFLAILLPVVFTQLALGMEARATLLFLTCTTETIIENILTKIRYNDLLFVLLLRLQF